MQYSQYTAPGAWFYFKATGPAAAAAMVDEASDVPAALPVDTMQSNDSTPAGG